MFVDFVGSVDLSREIISDVVHDVLESVKAPYNAAEPHHQRYGVASSKEETPLDYYPLCPDPIRGKANYTADRNRRNARNILNCNKISRRHKSMSQGIFTCFCVHGFSYGFSLLDKKESPKVAFEILMTRFPTMPRIVIYDNSCHLHLYAINRDPLKFANTMFLIDRLHSKGHLCTKGYHMNTYEVDNEIKNINSQIVEQANARLRNLSNQLACMSSDNALVHVKAFLAIKNLNIIVEYVKFYLDRI